MVSVLLSILTDFAGSAKEFFSSFGIEALGVLLLVIILKVTAEYCKNRCDVDWTTLHIVSKMDRLSQIMAMDWEPYSFLTRRLLTEQGYRIVGSSVNDLSGIDIIAEKAGKRILFRFGRSTAETIYEREIHNLLLKSRQYNAASGCIVTPGDVASSAEMCMKENQVSLVEKSELIDWFNQYAGTKIKKSPKEDMDIDDVGLSSHTYSDNSFAA